MRDRGQAVCVVSAIVLLLAAVSYVGGEGAWYAAGGTTYFGPGTVYRKVYAPLDAVSERIPALYDARETLANGWLRASGEEANAIVPIGAIFGCVQ